MVFNLLLLSEIIREKKKIKCSYENNFAVILYLFNITVYKVFFSKIFILIFENANITYHLLENVS